MLSLLHEALVLLFRNRPTLAPELLRDALGQEIPPFEEAQVHEATLSQIVPTEYQADLVVLLRAQVPVFGIVVEVQLSPDSDKRFSWPLYAAALRAKLRCPACVLVITPDPAVACWAAKSIDTGQPGSPFLPLVIGPSAIPRVTAETAQRSPELAVLSVQAHGHEQGALDLALAAMQATAHLDDKLAMLYCDLIIQAMGESARQQLEDMMQTGNYTFQSDFAKKYLAEGMEKGREKGMEEGRVKGLEEGRVKGLEEGREKGLEEGREKGLEEGREKGLEEGREKGRCSLVDILIKQLEFRFGPLEPGVIQRIQSASIEELQSWGCRVLAVHSINELWCEKEER